MSPDGRAIAIANSDNSVRIWHQGRHIPQIIKGHQAEVWEVAFSADSRLVASASNDGTVKLWTLKGKLLRTLVGHSAAVWIVAFSPDGKMVASGSGDNTVKLWRLDGEPALREGFQRQNKREGDPHQVLAPRAGDGEPRSRSVPVRPQAVAFAIGHRGQLLRTFKGHTAAIWGVAFSPDSKILASGSGDRTVKLWKLVRKASVQEFGTELTTLRGHTAAIREIAISRDGTMLVWWR